MEKILLVLPIITFYLLVSAKVAAPEQPQGVNEPVKIAPGLISTEMGEFSPSFDVVNQELFFMRRTPGVFDYTILSSKKTDDGWSTPDTVAFSGQFRDDAPYVSADGNTIWFDSRRPDPRVASGSINIWKTQRNQDGWNTPELVESASKNEPDESDSGVDEYGPAVDSKGDLYFYSFRKPHRPGHRYAVTKESDFNSISEDTSIPDPSAQTFVSYLSFSSDGNTAVMEGRHTGRGDTEVFYSCKDTEDNWSVPELLPLVNSRSSEGGPFITSDGEWLFFSSNRPASGVFDPNGELYMISTENLPIPCD